MTIFNHSQDLWAHGKGSRWNQTSKSLKMMKKKWTIVSSSQLRGSRSWSDEPMRNGKDYFLCAVKGLIAYHLVSRIHKKRLRRNAKHNHFIVKLQVTPSSYLGCTLWNAKLIAKAVNGFTAWEWKQKLIEKLLAGLSANAIDLAPHLMVKSLQKNTVHKILHSQTMTKMTQILSRQMW